jgi:hypothetical protein
MIGPESERIIPPPTEPHYEVANSELLANREKLPFIEPEIPPEWVDEARPLVATFEKTHPSIESQQRCSLTIERTSKKTDLLKLRIPVEIIPIPAFSQVTQSAWVDVGIQSLHQLAEMGEAQAANLAKILSTVKHFEKTHGVLIRGDGVICQKR